MTNEPAWRRMLGTTRGSWLVVRRALCRGRRSPRARPRRPARGRASTGWPSASEDKIEAERAAQLAALDDPRAIAGARRALRRSPARRGRRPRSTSGMRRRASSRPADAARWRRAPAAAQGGRGRATTSAASRCPVLAQLQLGSPDARVRLAAAEELSKSGSAEAAVAAPPRARARAGRQGARRAGAGGRARRSRRAPTPTRALAALERDRQERQRRLSFRAAAADRAGRRRRVRRARRARARRRGAARVDAVVSHQRLVELRRQPAARPVAGQRAAVRGAGPGDHLRPAGRHQHGPRRDADAGRLRDLRRADVFQMHGRALASTCSSAIPVAFLATGAGRRRCSSARSSATSTGARWRRCWRPGGSAWA